MKRIIAKIIVFLIIGCLLYYMYDGTTMYFKEPIKKCGVIVSKSPKNQVGKYRIETYHYIDVRFDGEQKLTSKHINRTDYINYHKGDTVCYYYENHSDYDVIAMILTIGVSVCLGIFSVAYCLSWLLTTGFNFK